MILELLRDLSADRQIILFTQEPEVLDWAQGHLDEEAVIQLEPDVIPA